MKNKWIFATLMLMAILGAGTALFFILGPKPVPKIKMSSFVGAQTVAEALVLRLNQELKQTSGFLLGVNPQEPFHLEVIKELSLTLEKSGIVFELLNQTVETFNPQNFHKAALEAQKNGKKVFSITTFVVAAHFREDWPGDYMTVSLYPLPRSKFQESKTELAENCTAEAATQGKDVSCLALSEARKNYSKTMDDSKWTGLMSQVGKSDYLFLLGREK